MSTTSAASPESTLPASPLPPYVYVWPYGGADFNTKNHQDMRGQPVKQLIGLVFFLHYRHSASQFVRLNGNEKIQEICRHLRARLFREQHQAPRGMLAHILNQLDPPHCRCGRPGLRIVSKITYCGHQKCPWTPISVQRLRTYSERKAAGQAERERDIASFDAYDASRRQFRQTKRKGFK